MIAGKAVYGPRSPDDETEIMYAGDGVTAHLLDPETAVHVRELGWEVGQATKVANIASKPSRPALRSLGSRRTEQQP